jgi:hypothetical protein
MFTFEPTKSRGKPSVVWFHGTTKRREVVQISSDSCSQGTLEVAGH